jgi:CRISPR type III-B/RAMP module RAMP protein Cmr1
MAVRPLEFEVEVVTPAFPGGPDPKGSDFEGVRPSSIIYGMRFWFRALVAATWGSSDLADIQNAESQVFGSSQDVRIRAEKRNGLRSRVRLAVVKNVDVGRCEAFEDQSPALRYLAYGLYPTKKGESWRRKFIPPGERFSFEVIVGKPSEGEPEIPEGLVKQLAELWIELGGLGARWRHGLGAMRLADNSSVLPKATGYGAEVSKRIASARREMADFLKTLDPSRPVTAEKTLPRFAVATPQHLSVAWCDFAGDSWGKTLEKIYGMWRESRKTQPGNRQSSSYNARLYADFLKGADLTGRRAELGGLGLPIPFGFPRPGNSGVAAGATGHLQPRGLERRASPIWFRPVKVAGSRGEGFGLLALHWRTQYLEGGDLELVDDRDKRREPVTFDPTDAEQWFKGFLLQKEHKFTLVPVALS